MWCSLSLAVTSLHKNFHRLDFMTWIGVFTTDKLFKVDALDSFKPDIVWMRNEVEFKTPTEMVVRVYNTKGEKTGEWIYKKVK